jgi:hypothetical protein
VAVVDVERETAAAYQFAVEDDSVGGVVVAAATVTKKEWSP